MNSSVIVFPGSNCDRDIAVALKKMQFKNQMVWHKETKLPKSDLIVVPGGFSYGDYLRSGAIAGKSLIINEVIKAAKDGCLILGICNGFQILTETGLLKGVLLRNKNLKFINGQFMGIIYIPKKYISKVIKFYENYNNHKIQFTGFLNYLISNKIKINCIKYEKFWYEFDDYDDLNNFNKLKNSNIKKLLKNN